MTGPLRCGVQGLPAAETTLVRTLFKLYHHGASDFRWALVDVPPYDAMLVDSNANHAEVAQGHPTVKAVLTVGSTGPAASPNTLTRPLRSEMLEAWLLQVQRQFSSPTGSTAPAQALPTLATASEAREPDAYKLSRWPPAAVLRNDASLIRMATALSRRPMTLIELARLSQQPVERVRSFVRVLRKADLLERPAPVRAARHSPQNDSPRRSAAPEKIERSLISRIRLRLGLALGL